MGAKSFQHSEFRITSAEHYSGRLAVNIQSPVPELSFHTSENGYEKVVFTIRTNEDTKEVEVVLAEGWTMTDAAEKFFKELGDYFCKNIREKLKEEALAEIVEDM